MTVEIDRACGHGDEYLGFYAHPEKDVMVAFCVKCYEQQHPIKLEPFITRYGRKLLEQESKND